MHQRLLFFMTLGVASLLQLSCKDLGTAKLPNSGSVSTDAELFQLVTETEPFTTYSLFPRVDSLTSGTLNGSNAHWPLVRVSMNATALAALQHDTLPRGSSFPDGSILFKQIISGNQTILYAMMYKDRSNSPRFCSDV